MKKLYGIVLSVICASLAAACGKVSAIVPQDLADALCAAPAFSEQLTPIDSAAAERLLYLNPGDYSEITMYVGTAATTEEFAVISSTNTDDVKAKLETYIEGLKNEYGSYRSAETTKLDNAYITEYKGTVVMIISADPAAAQQAYEDYLKK